MVWGGIHSINAGTRGSMRLASVIHLHSRLVTGGIVVPTPGVRPRVHYARLRAALMGWPRETAAAFRL